MFRRTLWAGIAVAALASASPALASKRMALPSVAAVQQRAAALPPASTPAAAASDQAALQPEVNAAVSQGRSAVAALLSAGNPAVAADLVKDATVTITATDTQPGLTSTTVTTMTRSRVTRKVTRHQFKAHATACWGTHDTRTTISAGVTFGWRQVQEEGWCGNGTTITSQNGATYSQYHAGPYCWNDVSEPWAWDGSHAWLHGRNYGVLGGSYIWGCASLQTVHPAIRMSATGHFDHYDDF